MKRFVDDLVAAIQMFYQDQGALIEHRVHERTIASWVHSYLVKLGGLCYDGLYWDCEYNRMRNQDPKISCPRKRIVPDLILHDRGSRNMVICEMKAVWDVGPSGRFCQRIRKGICKDYDTLRSAVNGCMLGYCVGLHVIFTAESFYMLRFERGGNLCVEPPEDFQTVERKYDIYNPNENPIFN